MEEIDITYDKLEKFLSIIGFVFELGLCFLSVYLNTYQGIYVFGYLSFTFLRNIYQIFGFRIHINTKLEKLEYQNHFLHKRIIHFSDIAYTKIKNQEEWIAYNHDDKEICKCNLNANHAETLQILFLNKESEEQQWMY